MLFGYAECKSNKHGPSAPVYVFWTSIIQSGYNKWAWYW